MKPHPNPYPKQLLSMEDNRLLRERLARELEDRKDALDLELMKLLGIGDVADGQDT